MRKRTTTRTEQIFGVKRETPVQMRVLAVVSLVIVGWSMFQIDGLKSVMMFIPLAYCLASLIEREVR